MHSFFIVETVKIVGLVDYKSYIVLENFMSKRRVRERTLAWE